jgi:hypothetical protein
MFTSDVQTTERLNNIMEKYHNAFATISTGSNTYFDECYLCTLFSETRDAMDLIYTGSEAMFKDAANTDTFMCMYQEVSAVTRQFDDPLQAGLMMKMDVFAAILATHNVALPPSMSSYYIVDSRCASVDFSGLFFEEAVPNGPWKPSAEDVPGNGNWIQWYQMPTLLSKRKFSSL